MQKEIVEKKSTVDDSGKVTGWDVRVLYTKDDYSHDLPFSFEVEPTKEPEDFSDAELFEASAYLDEVFASMYESTH
jgi:hypothetical protein